jgi:hypothetical protein
LQESYTSRRIAGMPERAGARPRMIVLDFVHFGRASGLSM